MLHTIVLYVCPSHHQNLKPKSDPQLIRCQTSSVLSELRCWTPLLPTVVPLRKSFLRQGRCARNLNPSSVMPLPLRSNSVKFDRLDRNRAPLSSNAVMATSSLARLDKLAKTHKRFFPIFELQRFSSVSVVKFVSPEISSTEVRPKFKT